MVIPSAEEMGDGGPGDDGAVEADQGKLFYECRLDDRISKNHLLRRIDVVVTVANDGPAPGTGTGALLH
jgi:hypothetical protein